MGCPVVALPSCIASVARGVPLMHYHAYSVPEDDGVTLYVQLKGFATAAAAADFLRELMEPFEDDADGGVAH